MLRAERPFPDRQRALVHRLRFGVAALIAMRLPKVIQTLSYLRVIRAERAFPNLQRTLVQRLRLGVPALFGIGLT